MINSFCRIVSFNRVTFQRTQRDAFFFYKCLLVLFCFLILFLAVENGVSRVGKRRQRQEKNRYILKDNKSFSVITLNATRGNQKFCTVYRKGRVSFASQLFQSSIVPFGLIVLEFSSFFNQMFTFAINQVVSLLSSFTWFRGFAGATSISLFKSSLEAQVTVVHNLCRTG